MILPAANPFRIAVLISGGGTTLKNLIEKIEAGCLRVEIALVVSSSPTARGLQYAADAGIPAEVVEAKQFLSQEAFSDCVFAHCRKAAADLVVMAGFLKRVTVPGDFINRVLNIHPGLIPAFCGQGFYGHRVHQAVLDYGAKLSGCTVHFADNQYDHGPVILQRAVPVLDDDTAETLAARIFEAECAAYPEAIQLIAEGRVRVEGRKVHVTAACPAAGRSSP
jgi:phosphoribosylglycinamide formyltransferase-1